MMYSSHSFRGISLTRSRDPLECPRVRWLLMGKVQGYLADQTPPTRRTLQQSYAYGPMVILRGVGVSNERDTPLELETIFIRVGVNTYPTTVAT